MISKLTFRNEKSAAPAGCEVVERGPSTWAQAKACYLGRWHFCFIILLSAFCICLTGCCVTAGTDGTIKVISCRLLWKSEDVAFAVRGTNINARLTLGKSITDADAVGSVSEGAVKALTRP